MNTRERELVNAAAQVLTCLGMSTGYMDCGEPLTRRLQRAVAAYGIEPNYHTRGHAPDPIKTEPVRLDAAHALEHAIKVADEARREWDVAPNGMRAGKIIIALSGHLPGYRADIDEIHAARSGAVR